MNKIKYVGFALMIGLLVGCVSPTPKSTLEGASEGGGNVQLKVGDPAPDFRLPDHKGGYVRLSDFRGKSNVVLAFYPAAFTPV